MCELLLHNRPVKTLFDLLGYQENDLTKSLGWTLSRCPSLLGELVKTIVGRSDGKGVIVRLQEFASADRGYTDIEVMGTDFGFIIEAKLGWELPTRQQLERYCGRLDRFATAKLVSISQWSSDYARHHLSPSIPSPAGRQVDVMHLAWSDVMGSARRARPRGSHGEKRQLDLFIEYLEGAISMQDQWSNIVFVAPLRRTPVTKDGRSTVDIKNDHGIYWYPMGKKRLKEAPNYIGFYYDGSLHTVHHVEKSEVVTDLTQSPLSKGVKLTPFSTPTPHFIFKLGPAMRPTKKVKNGRIFAGNTYRCMLDTLLTSETIADAYNETNRRNKKSL